MCLSLFHTKKSSLPFLYRPPPIPRRPPQLISVVPHQRDSHISRRLLISHQDTLSSEEEKSSPSITISRRCRDVAIELFYCHPLLMSRRSRCSIFCQSGVCTLCFTTTRAHGCDNKYCSCSQKIYYRTHPRTKRAVNNRLLGKVSKKTDLFGTLSQTMGIWVQRWVQSPKLFSENNHSVNFTANIQKCPKTCNT